MSAATSTAAHPSQPIAHHIPPNQQITIEADDEEVEDEAYATDTNSSYSSSISSSIRAYRRENGRTYHAYKDGSYAWPNDEIENDRLDFQHAIFLRSLGGKLFLSPIPEDVQEVLDVGTGTGIWAIDFADEFPSARVTGTDLSPIQPDFVPPNLRFYVEDMESEWAGNIKYDFIHARMMNGSFGNSTRFFEQSFRNLKPGGYLEMQDMAFPLRCDDGTMAPGTPLYEYGEFLATALGKMGRPCRGVVEGYKTAMEEQGFVDVVEVVHKWPINTWPKDIELKELGMWNMENFLQVLQGSVMAAFTRAFGWSSEEVEVWLVNVRKDIQNRKIHAYWPIHIVYGRKPEGK